MNLILRLFMTCSSVSFFAVVYLVQNKIDLLPSLSARLGHIWPIYLLYVDGKSLTEAPGYIFSQLPEPCTGKRHC